MPVTKRAASERRKSTTPATSSRLAPARHWRARDDRGRARHVGDRGRRQRRLDPARRDGVDADAVRRPGDGERLRELRDAALRRGVGRRMRRAEEGVHRRGVDDRALRLRRALLLPPRTCASCRRGSRRAPSENSRSRIRRPGGSSVPAQLTSASIRGQRSTSAATERSSVTSSRTASIIGSGAKAAISSSPMPPATTRQPAAASARATPSPMPARPAGDDGEADFRRFWPLARTSRRFLGVVCRPRGDYAGRTAQGQGAVSSAFTRP